MPPGSLQRCSQLRPAIHPLGGKIDKAISSTGIKADGERESAHSPASSLQSTYCQDTVQMAVNSGVQ